MVKLRWIPVVALGCVLLASPAAGQEATGACWNLADLNAGCIPDVTQQQCIDIYFWTEPGWSAGSDCAGLDLPFDWDGSCTEMLPDIGERCILLWADPQEEFTSVEHCEGEGGTWFDNLTCTEVPVPAVPHTGLAALALVLVASALLTLTAKRG